jgi:hypothetical protein
MTRTVSEAWETIHTDRPLVSIANDHATSRVLSERTRTTFVFIRDGVTTSPDERADAFFEAAASMSTRLGQSYARRVALGDLHRLRKAVNDGLPIPRDVTYTVGLPVDVTLHPDGTVTLRVDVSEAADIESDVVNYEILKQHSEAISVAIDANNYTVS